MQAMAKPREVQVAAIPPARLAPLIGPERAARFEGIAAAAGALLAGRMVANVNSTAIGGGVAEMLQTLLAYARGAGIDARWLVMDGNAAFFTLTKRLHNLLHGSQGDGGRLGAEERAIYDAVSRDNAEELLSTLRRGDVALLHDPQTAGLVGPLKRAGLTVVWRSHIGSDHPNEHSERGWAFLEPFLAEADAYVFTREPYAPRWLDRARLHVVAPSLDPFSPKNLDLPRTAVLDTLAYAGLVEGHDACDGVAFVRRDGSPGRLDRHADVLQTGPPPPLDAPLVVQVSRWDRLKDMQGVMDAFARHVDRATGAHLLLVGPNVSGVTDDPEGAEVLTECMAAWHDLPHAERSRVHLACLPTADVDENGIMVNAVQRHATVVTQKSIAEGFGLTVAEAMWKGRPVVASRVGGIVDQIEDGVSGLLLDDPADGEAFARLVQHLVTDPDERARIGANARRRATEAFLGDRHLSQYAELIGGLVQRAGAGPGAGA